MLMEAVGNLHLFVQGLSKDREKKIKEKLLYK